MQFRMELYNFAARVEANSFDFSQGERRARAARREESCSVPNQGKPVVVPNAYELRG